MALYLTQIGMILTLHSSVYIDVIYQRFFSILLRTVESFIPHKKVIIRPRDKWMTGQIRQAIRKRDRLKSLFQTLGRCLHGRRKILYTRRWNNFTLGLHAEIPARELSK